ncbi:MAG TPA: type II secretion system F family protein [Polyangiaceae bacterium]|nr:type II secretion system F family protein [Polyangiaceae bacterium]
MSLPQDLGALKWATCAGLLLLVLVIVYAVAINPESPPHRAYLRYIGHLDLKLGRMLLPTRARWIVVGQLFVLELVALACAALGENWLLVGIPIALLAPVLYVEQLRRARVARIEKQVDSFMLTLANALRATPSIGNALSYTHHLVAEPIRSELGICLHEVRVGNSVEQALLNMGARVQCPTLDSALQALLIGRQVGGDLTKILETTAVTLREMARLQGVLRTKTAESKVQILVIALMPVGLVYGLSRMTPGFFDPLFADLVGKTLLVVAVVLWLGAMLLARKILAVEL